MKKCLAVFLAVLMLLSAGAVLAFAEDEATTYEITFLAYDEDGVEIMNETVVVAEGDRPMASHNPTCPNGLYGTEYTFRGWVRADDTSEEPEVFSPYLLPDATESVTYKAVFEVTKEGKDTSDNITLFGFLSSIFSRLNQVLARLTYIIKRMTKALRIGSRYVSG